MVAVRDQSGAIEALTAAEPNLGSNLVADEADDSGERKHPEMCQRLR